MAVVLKEVCLEERRFGPVNLSIEGGEMILLCGLSGSGKSTLCSLLCGRLDQSAGTLQRDPGLRLGFVAHDFENQLIGTTVREELRVGASDAPLSEELVVVIDQLELSIKKFEAQDPHDIPAAFQQILLLCSLVRAGARLLVLDESLSHLDPSAMQLFLSALKQLCDSGVSFILASHQSSVLEHVDRVVLMREGRVLFDSTASEFSGELAGSAGFVGWSGLENLANNDAVTPIEVSGEGARLDLLTSLVIGGLAGSGKSRVLSSLYGLSSWNDWVTRDPDHSRALLRERVGASFWRSSVSAEWLASVSALRTMPDQLAVVLKESLPEDWLGRRPDQLSHGQLRYLGSLCLMAQYPEILYLDAPFRGLDGELRNRLARCLSCFLGLGGRIVVTTHDAELLDRLGHSMVWLEAGEVRYAGLVADWQP